MMATATSATNKAFLGTGWKFPIRPDSGGALNWSSGEQSVQEAVWIILGTATGERQMLPQCGCGIQDDVFAPNSSIAQVTVMHQVKQALTTGEPRIDVLDVTVTAPDGQPNLMLIRVDYRVRDNNAVNNMVYPFYISEGTGG